MQKQKKVSHWFIKLFFLTLGPIIAAFAIESFLVPNNIIDGGVVGISIITNYLSKINLGTLIFILNIPFSCLHLTKSAKNLY